MSSSSKRVSKKYIDEYKTTSGTIVRKINIPLPKEMPMSIKKAMEDKVKADIEEWKKQYRKSRREMMQQSPKKRNLLGRLQLIFHHPRISTTLWTFEVQTAWRKKETLGWEE